VGFLIDTNLWISIERGRLSAADIHAITKQEPIFLSPVNVAELRFGIDLMLDARQKQKAMAMLRRLRRKPFVPITRATGEVFGALAAKLSQARRGADFRVQDVWLAAQTVERRFTLLTSNARDFQDIPDLKFLVVSVS
jgi:predicted nucleic acid-binding protein